MSSQLRASPRIFEAEGRRSNQNMFILFRLYNKQEKRTLKIFRRFKPGCKHAVMSKKHIDTVLVLNMFTQGN